MTCHGSTISIFFLSDDVSTSLSQPLLDASWALGASLQHHVTGLSVQQMELRQIQYHGTSEPKINTVGNEQGIKEKNLLNVNNDFKTLMIAMHACCNGI